jgi:peptidoglycan/LPS O-acetylase OafA/YrhL
MAWNGREPRGGRRVAVPAPTTGDRRHGPRLTSLDGLRGLAALIVVVHHCALAAPVLAAQYQVLDPHAPHSWLTFSPVHLVWAGGEAVLVFFVLSGLVLSRPFLTRVRPGSWLAYYPKRLVRLYVPVVAAVLLAGVVITLVPRTGGADWGWWMTSHVLGADPGVLAHDALLLDGTSWSNSALWSLKYEVLFSLLLPVFVVVARGLDVPLWTTLPVAGWAVYWTTAHGHQALAYLSVFAVGVLLAHHLDELQALGERITAGRAAGLRWPAVLAVALVLLGAQWWPRLLLDGTQPWLVPAGRSAVAIGAAVLIFCFLCSPGVRAFGNSPPLQWLGAVSFSLYLVHEPLVVAVATKLPPSLRSLPVGVGVGLAVSLAVALLFHHLVERPAQRLATGIGESVRQWQRGPAAHVRGAGSLAPAAAGSDTVVLPAVVIGSGARVPEHLPRPRATSHASVGPGG